MTRDLIEEARRVSVREFCASRGIRIKHGDQGSPYPGCGGRDRFSVNLRKGVWQCRVSGLGGDAIALAQHIDGTDFLAACEAVIGRAQPARDDRPRPAQRPQPVEPYDDASARANRERALRLWSECGTEATPVDLYLASRGLRRDAGTDRALRYHASCPMRDDEGDRVFGPAMVCAMRSIAECFRYITCEGLDADELDGPRFITAIHRTGITIDGRKRFKTRQMLGPTRGSAIMFDDVCSVLEANSVVIAEGVETALSMRTLGWWPVWALGSAGAIAAFEPIPNVSKLIIAGENDAASRAARPGVI